MLRVPADTVYFTARVSGVRARVHARDALNPQCVLSLINIHEKGQFLKV